jgi:hypothetical protein
LQEIKKDYSRLQEEMEEQRCAQMDREAAQELRELSNKSNCACARRERYATERRGLQPWTVV